MEVICILIIIGVAALHLYFFYLESFAWETLGKKTFKNIPHEHFPITKSFAANQGVYNAFLAFGLLWSLMWEDPIIGFKIALFFLTCVAVAGIVGWITVNKRIFYIQSVPALIGMLSILITLYS